jgi:hypothetical protein
VKLIAIAVLAASTLCFAQTPQKADSAPPTVAELQQQIKTLIATRQVYYERLEKITEFQKYVEADQQMAELQRQKQQINAAAQHPAMSKEQEKAAEVDFKKMMQERIAAEKAADAKKH